MYISLGASLVPLFDFLVTDFVIAPAYSRVRYRSSNFRPSVRSFVRPFVRSSVRSFVRQHLRRSLVFST